MRKRTILMIEDESDILAKNKEFLEREGFDTSSAATLAEARRKLEDAPDLILLDVMMPDGLSWYFAEEIHAKQAPLSDEGLTITSSSLTI